jgi:F0F1-type ATP synthase assembly protein I
MQEKKALWQGLSLAWQLGYTIAIPLIIFALLGRFLDKRYETSPLFLLGAIFLSLIVSGVGIYKKVFEIIKDLEQEERKK